ncbi:MAG: hypothetical protein WBG11_07755 [Methylocella sp.]
MRATPTETLRGIAARASADVLGARCPEDNGKAHHIAIVHRQAQDERQDDAGERGRRRQGRTCACGVPRRRAGDSRTPGFARAKAFEIPDPLQRDPLKLLERLDRKGKIVAAPRSSGQHRSLRPSSKAATTFFWSRTTGRT